MTSPSDLVQLASSLREECIFVKAETQQLSKLNAQLTSSTEGLYHQAWIARTQRRALELLLNQRGDLPADSCLYRLNSASATVPVDGYRVLGYKESAYGECLKIVRENPELLAECLVRGERSNPEKMQEALRIVMGSLYGYGLIPEDQEYSLKLLKSLIEIQLDASSNPRRLLTNVSTFSYAYKIFVENLHETKLYLATALHQPILQALAEDDVFLDIEASKLPFRFSTEDKKKKFGDEGTEQYEGNLKEYRARVIKRLVRLAQRFMQGLVDNLFCFPPSLCWIISQVYERIESQHPSQSTLPAVICTELIFSHFICPAIVQPEPYALTSDIPVSYVARHNLMQIAQILQTMAVSKWEPTDPKLMDVYGGFETGCMWKILDVILEMRTSDILVTPSLPSDSLNRSAVLLSVAELNSLVTFVKETSADKPGSRVPSDIFRNLVHNLAPIEPMKRKEEDLPPANTGTLVMHTSASKQKLKSVLLKSLDISSVLGDGDIESSHSSVGSNGMGPEENQVLVISLGARETGELGLLSEQKVLAMCKKSQKTRNRVSEDLNSCEIGSFVDDEAMSAFSVCSSIPDSVSAAGPGKAGPGFGPNRFDDSLPLPTDSLGAVSEEMASHHSVASSVDDVIQNDNLSDVEISPIISGRASPSVSTGRDTPSPPTVAAAALHQLENMNLAEPVPLNAMVQPRLVLPRDLPVTVRRTNREDVPEKFGKFDLPTDETRSTMSDAWSTEVAGSDFGNLIDPLPVHGPPPPNLNMDPILDDPVFAIAAAGGFDSDDDRWSVDVAASVSNASQEPLEDRMAELENEPPVDPAVFRDDPVPFEVMQPVLPNPPGKYVSFANDDKFHHYPPENEFSIGSYGSGGGSFADRSRDFEDEDPTLNLPLNVFPPVNLPFENSMGGSVPSSCSSFSNLSGFDSFESDGPANGFTKHPVLEKSASANLFGSLDPFGQPPFGTPFDVSPKKPPIPPGRKGSLCHESVKTSKELPARPLSYNLGSGPRVEILVGPPSGPSPGLPSKKGSFLKNFAHNLRSKQKRNSGKFETPPHSAEKLTLPKPGNVGLVESPDDILAKYRKKTGPSAVVPAAPSLPQLVPMTVTDSVDNVCMMDFAGISEEVMLETAKRKVRIVLNSFDPGSIPCLKMRLLTKNGSGSDHVLLSFLKIQLSEAISLQDRNLVAQLHEAIRCIKALEGRGIKRLIEALRLDYRSRDVYISYLIRCRKTLLNSLQHIDKLVSRTKRDSDVCTKYFISSCVSQFLEKHDREIRTFVRDFQKLSLSDEKTALVENLLGRLYGHMNFDSLWQSCTEQQSQDARETIERQIMSQVFRSALYPNDEVDIMRDQVLHDHMRKLAKTLTPDHKDLKISKIFHLECPWPSAQAEISTINAYKTPKDKVQCVVRCSCTLMNLLSLAADSSVPAADDFMPALVYVLIRANPQSLLSTVQYVNNFYGSRLGGEEAYWWTQFASAIEYIKNMDYPEETHHQSHNGRVYDS